MHGGYGKEYVERISKTFDQYGDIEGKEGLVIGSQSPWLEAILLAKGASKVK
jgi:hypothetical protein